MTEFSARARLRARTFDANRSFIERIVSFPANIEVEATHTFTSPPDTTTPAGPPQPPNPFLGAGMRTGSGSVVMHYSMVKLPETPMMARLFDERVGYFTVRQTDYGQEEHRAPQRRYITRWRLEKKDPNAAVVLLAGLFGEAPARLSLRGAVQISPKRRPTKPSQAPQAYQRENRK